jgi:hypothetical protein
VEQGCRAHRPRSTLCPCQAWLSASGRRIEVGLREAARLVGGFCVQSALSAAVRDRPHAPVVMPGYVTQRNVSAVAAGIGTDRR